MEDSAPRVPEAGPPAIGITGVYTPKDFELNRIMTDIVALADPAAVAAE